MIMFLSRAKIRLVCLLPIITRLGYLISVLFHCDTDPQSVWYPPGPLCIILMVLGRKWGDMTIN